MAHFAQLAPETIEADGQVIPNPNANMVGRVIVVSNEELIDDNGKESEAKGIAFCQSLFGGIWKQTSYNGNFRKNYAGVGHTYDSVRDAFIPPQVYPSWVLDEATCQWQPPVAYPTDGKSYTWDEGQQSWVEVTE